MSCTASLRTIPKSSSSLPQIIRITNRQIRLVRVPTLLSTVMDTRPTRIYQSRRLISSRGLDLAPTTSAESCVPSLKRTPKSTRCRSVETRHIQDFGTRRSLSSSKTKLFRKMTSSKPHSQSSCVKHQRWRRWTNETPPSNFQVFSQIIISSTTTKNVVSIIARRVKWKDLTRRFVIQC